MITLFLTLLFSSNIQAKLNFSVARLADDICADVWCEGEYNWKFQDTRSGLKITRLGENKKTINCQFPKMITVSKINGELSEEAFKLIDSCINKISK